ncbi:MAG: TolC family protein [Candidatus Margulisiibacteriota bacterium]
MRGVIIFIITLLIFAPVYGLSLDQAVSMAKKQNPEISAWQSIWKAAQAKVVQVSTWPDPQIEVMYEQIPQAGGSLADAQMKMYGFSQMIPFPGTLTLKRLREEDAAKAAQEKFQAKTNEIIAKVKNAYYALYYLNQAIEINQENKSLLNKFAKIAQAKYVVGKASQHDVIKSQVELDLLTNKLITLEQKRQTARARLNTLLNREPATQIDLPKEIKINDPALSLAKLEQTALRNRPELQAAAHQVEQTEKSHTLAKMQYLPDFKIKVLQREMQTTGLNGWNVSLMANLPVWFWAKTSAVTYAGENQAAAEASWQNLKNMVRFEVQDSYVAVDSAKRLAALFKNKIIPQAEQALRSATIAYQSDKVDFLTLINSQKTLEDSKLKYWQAFSGLGQSLAELERIIGGFNNEK